MPPPFDSTISHMLKVAGHAVFGIEVELERYLEAAAV
jgi:hypothetical protein